MGIVRIKRSTTQGSIPQGLVAGELALNLADRKLYALDGTSSLRSMNFTSDAEKVASGPIKQALDNKRNNTDLINQTDLDNTVTGKYYPKAINRKADLIADFNAIGDGVANDSPAIQNAINTVADRGGGTIVIPPLRFGVGTSITLRNGVFLEGVTISSPQEAFLGSTFIAINNLNTMITQTDVTQILHSVGISKLNIDGGLRASRVVNYGILLSCVNSRFTHNFIRKFSGTGFMIKTNPVAAWINWFTNNYVEMCGVGVNWQGTDSYITNNYLSTCTSYNLILDSTGGNQVTGNMIDASGRAFETVAANPNGVGLLLRNLSQKDQGPTWKQSRNVLTGNHFGENYSDIVIADNGELILSGHIIVGNLFHNVVGNSISIYPNNRGGNIMGNDFSDIGANSGCVVFYGDASKSPGWNLGPNTFSNTDFGLKYVNVPTGTQILGYQ